MVFGIQTWHGGSISGWFAPRHRLSSLWCTCAATAARNSLVRDVTALQWVRWSCSFSSIHLWLLHHVHPLLLSLLSLSFLSRGSLLLVWSVCASASWGCLFVLVWMRVCWRWEELYARAVNEECFSLQKWIRWVSVSLGFPCRHRCCRLIEFNEIPSVKLESKAWSYSRNILSQMLHLLRWLWAPHCFFYAAGIILSKY